MANTWQIDPKTGDYIMTGGAPAQDDTLVTPAYIRLKTHRNGWMYAPDTSYGSDFYLMHKRVKNSDLNSFNDAAQRALAPIVADGRAISTETKITATARGGIQMQSNIVDSAGNPQQLTFTPVNGGL